MAYPFFSLAKSKRLTPIDFRAGSISIRVEAVPEHGMATVWDADVLICAASQIVEARDAGLNTSRLMAVTPYEILTFVGRGASAPDYLRLKAALDRLQSTTVATSIRHPRASGLWLWPLLIVFAWSSVFFNLNPVYDWATRAALDYQTEMDGIGPHPRFHRQAAGRPISVQGSRDVRERGWNTSLLLDGDTGALRYLDLPTGEHSGNTVTSWLWALHFGDVYGFLPYRIFVCALGLVIVMLSVTGVYIWWKKRLARKFSASRRNESAAAEVAADDESKSRATQSLLRDQAGTLSDRPSCHARGASAPQQPVRAQILVDLRPMDAEAAARDFPAGELSRGRLGKARIPGQRHGDRSSIHQFHGQAVFAGRNFLDAKISGGCQRRHAMPPRAVPGAPAPDVAPRRASWPRIRRCTPGRYSRAKIWPKPCPDPHGHEAVRLVHGCKNITGSPGYVKWLALCHGPQTHTNGEPLFLHASGEGPPRSLREHRDGRTLASLRQSHPAHS
jgi:hypothetical protein